MAQQGPEQTLNFLKSISNSTNNPTRAAPAGNARLLVAKTSDGKGNGKTWSTNDLFSQATLNRYLAAQTVQYLTGLTDVSYYDSYVTASSADGFVSFGRTKTGKSSLERVKSVLNYGLKTTLLNGLGNVFSGHKFSRDIGLYLNYTLFNKGRVWYNPPQADTMRFEREYIEQTIAAGLKSDSTIFAQKQALALVAFNTRNTTPTITGVTAFTTSQKRDLDAFNEAQNTLYKETYFTMEEAAGKPRVNYVHSTWFTPRFTVSGTTDSVTPDLTMGPTDRFFFPVSAGLSYSVYNEDFRPGKWNRPRLLTTLSADVKNTNQLRLLGLYGAEAATKLGGKSITKDGATYWQGQYDVLWALNFQARTLLSLPKVSNIISLDLLGDLTTGRYSTLNLSAGFLFALPAQDRTTTINIELMGTFRDVGRRLMPGKDAWDRFQVGISLALPFNSNLNNL